MQKQQIYKKNSGEPFVIGIAGGIGGGKTTAAQILSTKGAYIIDADEISKKVTAPGTECYQRLLAAFPSCATGGVLHRPLLKQLVFSDEGCLKLLNGITHPCILTAIRQEILDKKWVAVQAPLLFESGFDGLCDVTLGIWADDKIRTERILERDKMTADLAAAIMKMQLPKEALQQKCDFFIENNGDLAQLEESIEQFYQKIKYRIQNLDGGEL